VLSFNLLGDAWRDWLDPRRRVVIGREMSVDGRSRRVLSPDRKREAG